MFVIELFPSLTPPRVFVDLPALRMHLRCPLGRSNVD
jgi:hypothetical protein